MDPTLPPWQRRDSFHPEPHQRHIDATNKLLNLSVADGSDVYDLGNGRGIVPHGVAQVRLMRAFKITGETKLGGCYKLLFGSPGSNTLNLSPTSATTLSLTNSIDFTNTNNTGFLINTKETGLQLHLLSTSDGVVRWGPLIYSATNNTGVVVTEVPLPPTLSCTNTAAATNAPVYTLFRHGTGTSQALAVSQTPWRQVSLTGISGTSLPTITAATNCNYFLSGTGVVMAGSSETIPNNLCT
jgi:hypothetical protein